MAWRVIAGRRVVVVPVAVAVGWELNVDDRVVVVREVRPSSVVVVPIAGGAPEELEIQKEDTSENAVEEQGSVVPDGDAAPAKEAEEEVDEEVDG